MGVVVRWDNPEKTILCYEFQGLWRWDELYTAIDQSQAMQNTVSHTVDLLLDMRDGGLMPRGIITNFAHLANLSLTYPGSRVIVGSSLLLSGLFNTFTKFYVRKDAHQYFYAHTIDEAYSIIAQNQAKRQNQTGDG